MSLFAADVAAPTLDGLGGLLAAHGQITRSATGSRLSILLLEQWRADAVQREFELRGLRSTVVSGSASAADAPSLGTTELMAEAAAVPSLLVRSERSRELDPLAAAWTRGSVKTVPSFPVPPGELLRCWAVVAGRPDRNGYLLGTDRHASHLYPRLAATLSGAGLTAAVIGARGGGPGMRIVGRRRLERLAELLGTPPPGAPQWAFPAGR